MAPKKKLSVKKEEEQKKYLCEEDVRKKLGLSEGEEGRSMDEKEARVRECFEEADTNGDKVLSKEEFMNIFTRIDIPADLTPELIEGLFKQIDTDHDQVITFDEFFAYMYPKPTDSKTWPLAKLHTAIDSNKGKSGPRAVLLTTGAMNPAHLGHVQLLHQAKFRLEKEGYVVVGSWMSPSHDLYVLPKAQSLKTPGLSSDFRLTIARMATMADDFVAVGSWEATQEGYWPDYPVVAKALQDELDAKVQELKDSPDGHVSVFYACGTDHASKCGLYNGLSSKRSIGVVVVPREGEKPAKENPAKLVFVADAAEGEVASFSSTKVRKALQTGDAAYVAKAVSPDAATLLLQPGEDDIEHFKKDFKQLGIKVSKD